MRRQITETTTWFFNVLKDTKNNPSSKVTAVFDLDYLLLMTTPRLKPQFNTSFFRKFDYSFITTTSFNPVFQLTFQVDSNAFLKIKEIQDNGHTIAVVTCASYPYELINEIFNQFSVKLDKHNFHNRENIEARGFKSREKAKYIDAQPSIFDEKCMLFDDHLTNRPEGKCLFMHVPPEKSFPSFRQVFLHTVAINKILINTFDTSSITRHERDIVEQLVREKNIDALKQLGHIFLDDQCSSMLCADDLYAMHQSDDLLETLNARLFYKIVAIVLGNLDVNSDFYQKLKSINQKYCSYTKRLELISQEIETRAPSSSIVMFFQTIIFPINIKVLEVFSVIKLYLNFAQKLQAAMDLASGNRAPDIARIS